MGEAGWDLAHLPQLRHRRLQVPPRRRRVGQPPRAPKLVPEPRVRPPAAAAAAAFLVVVVGFVVVVAGPLAAPRHRDEGLRRAPRVRRRGNGRCGECVLRSERLVRWARIRCEISAQYHLVQCRTRAASVRTT